VSWFSEFFSKKSETQHQEIPFSTITRWSLYDLMLDNPNKVAVDLGLNPVSDEGHDKEREDSDGRLSNVQPLLPFIEVTSELTARILSSVQLSEIDALGESVDLDQDDIDVMIAFFKSVALSSLIVAFSSALQLDMIHSNIDSLEEME
jgi:hypothetical protein